MEKTATTHIESAHDMTRLPRASLESIFRPRNIAVIGATETEGRLAKTILQNLVNHPFGGTVFPVNPNHRNVLGIKTYPDIGAVPEPVDLAIIATRAETVPGLIGECVEAEVKGAIITSAGFRETGESGSDLEREILEQARGRIRIVGPNSFGIMYPATHLNASISKNMAHPGNVAFLSQSGALCAAVLDWSFGQNVGFSAFVSLGSMLDVGWGDLIDLLGDDPHTRSIIIYMESIGDARAFLSAAREAALSKPIIVLKAGRTSGAAKAAASHTGLLTGSDQVLDAAFRRSGTVRVNYLSDLFYMAEVLAKQPRPRGPRLTIVTNAGGPAVLAADALLANGGELADLSDASIQALDQILPPHWSRANPIDLLDEATPERYAQALDIAAKDPSGDGLLVILTPQALTEPTQTAELLKPFARQTGKPILASWMGGAAVHAGEEVLNHAGIPTFAYPDTAARMFDYMWRYTYNLRSIYETPTLASDRGADAPDRVRVDRIIAGARSSGRTILTEFESKQILAAYAIPTVETRVAKSEDEAVEIARALGYPVVLKLHSQTVTHKALAGGVHLDLADAGDVISAYRAIQAKVNPVDFLGVTVQPMVKREGYELILGSSIDSQFGPVLLFGAGGRMAEVFQDRSLALPPLTTTLARRTMEQTLIYTALKGTRGNPCVDLAELERLLVRFSQLIAEQRWIKEMDINPLLALPPTGDNSPSLIALDARVVLHDLRLDEKDLPPLAIRPYPIQYVQEWTAKDGRRLLIRPIRPEDEPLMIKFHATLSDQSVYMRYLHPILLSQRVAHERLARICFNDYDRELALVAERANPSSGEPELTAVGRLSKLHNMRDAEFAVLVSDDAQSLGLGTELLRRLVEVGRDEHLARIVGYISTENVPMQKVSAKLGFKLKRMADDHTLFEAVLEL